MTVRVKATAGVTVYAGSPEELAAVAEEYAAGSKRLPPGLNAGHLTMAAEQLRDGVRVWNLGPLLFYTDRADGTPFRGPFAPEPDPGWLEREQVADTRR